VGDPGKGRLRGQGPPAPDFSVHKPSSQRPALFLICIKTVPPHRAFYFDGLYVADAPGA